MISLWLGGSTHSLADEVVAVFRGQGHEGAAHQDEFHLRARSVDTSVMSTQASVRARLCACVSVCTFAHAIKPQDIFGLQAEVRSAALTGRYRLT